MRNSLEEQDWSLLLKRIRDGKCTPFLGAGASAGLLPVGSTIASEWARERGYPFEDPHDLLRVAQYLAVVGDSMEPKDDLIKRFRDSLPKGASPTSLLHTLLAELPLPVYITTNYDDFMAQALDARMRRPRRELCAWNKYVRDRLQDNSSIFEKDPTFNPTPSTPLVFHLHGHVEMAESIVLTEDDYLDFLVNISRQDSLIPSRIQRALSGASVLFLGYRLADTDFRVLFRGLVGYLERGLQRTHVSVQLEPAGTHATDKQKAEVRTYLNKYFGKLDTKVYWGTCEEFAADLRNRWDRFNRVAS